MKDHYDFSAAKRGLVTPQEPESAGKVKITIRLDTEIVDYFGAQADASGGKVGYQSLINEALRRAIEAPGLEAMLRRTIREELKAVQPAA